jgi:putative phosphoribosyl transferase
MEERLVELKEMRDGTGLFRDRAHGGALLAEMLKSFSGRRAIILAIPAGGVPVAVPVAESLHLPMDLAVASKITLPWNTESGYGAVAFDGTVLLNEIIIPTLGLTDEEIREGIAKTSRKVADRLMRFRGTHLLPAFQGMEVILIDDGLASGITMEVTVSAVRRMGASRVAVAVPTAHLESVKRILKKADELYCPNVRSGWRFAVADAYSEWHDVTEDEAIYLLSKIKKSISEKH